MDKLGTLKAIWITLFEAGKIQGASTITQQLAKPALELNLAEAARPAGLTLVIGALINKWVRFAQNWKGGKK